MMGTELSVHDNGWFDGKYASIKNMRHQHIQKRPLSFFPGQASGGRVKSAGYPDKAVCIPQGRGIKPDRRAASGVFCIKEG